MTTSVDTVIDEDQSMTMEAILTRDQRTTFHRVLDRAAVQTRAPTAKSSTGREHSRSEAVRRYDVIDTRTRNGDNVQRQLRCSSYLVPGVYDDRGIRSRRNASVTATTWLRLGSLLVVLLLVTAHGAPTMTLEDTGHNDIPKWVNPCGGTPDDGSSIDTIPATDAELLRVIIVQTETALKHAEDFRDDYIKKTFNVDFASLHSDWKNKRYQWLPGPDEIPKQLGEELKKEYLDTLEFDTALRNAYEYMQKYAVGLEQIVKDQKDLRLEFSEMFKKTEEYLGMVLCELYAALAERGVPLGKDVERKIMPLELRTMSHATDRDLRDWLIFRDYMNGLQYVKQVFEHIRDNLQS